MKIHKSVVLVALLSACSPGDAPLDAEQGQQAAPTQAVPGQTAPVQPVPGQPVPGQPAPAPGAQAAPAAPASPADKKWQDAMNLIRKGDGKGALQILEGMRKESAATPPMLALLGALYMQENRPQDAMNVLRPLADGANGAEADPAVLYNAGRAALALGQAEAGQRYLQRSVEKSPISPAARELGLLLSRQGKIIEAYRVLRPYALRDPQDLESRMTAATLALRLERPMEAEDLLSGLSEKEPAIQLLRAQARIQRGDGKTALALLQPLEKNHPAGVDLEIRRSLAEAHLLAGNPAAALKLLEGRAAGHPGLTLLVARAQRQSGDTQAAMATLKPLVDKLPDDPKGVGDPRPAAGVAVEYGRLLLGSGNAQAALPLLEKGTRLNPSSQDAWEAYAEALTSAGRTQDATRARQKAQEIAAAASAVRPPTTAASAAAPAAPAGTAGTAAALSPDMAEAMRLVTAGQVDKALVAVRREIAANPANDRARILEVQLLLRAKDAEGALKAADAALKQDPNNIDFIYQRGAVLILPRRLPEAEKELRRVLAINPRHVPAMNDLAVVMMLQSKPSEAQKLLEQVLAINPNDANAKASLENLKKMPPPQGKGKG